MEIRLTAKASIAKVSVNNTSSYKNIALEVGKSVSNYSINYYNGGQYPIPHTILVFLFEFLKFCANFLRMHCTLPTLTENSIQNSFKFVVPSLVYAVNNNIYLGKKKK